MTTDDGRTESEDRAILKQNSQKSEKVPTNQAHFKANGEENNLLLLGESPIFLEVF